MTSHLEKDSLSNSQSWTTIPDFTKAVINQYRWLTFYGIVPYDCIGNVSHIPTAKISTSYELRAYVNESEVYVALKYDANNVLNYKVVGASVVKTTIMLDELV